MNPQAICSVIVTYHPTPDMFENLSRVRSQVSGIVVVDNGSNLEELNPLRRLCKSAGYHLIEHGDNLGIAEALNRGVEWAKSNGYDWVLLFDQDSKITDGFVSHMSKAWEAHPERDRIGSMHPTYIEIDTGIVSVFPRAADGGPIKSITSGALMPIWIFDKLGGFEAEYFIDEVDSEFCYRIRAAGYLISDSSKAKLLHRVGDANEATIFGFRCRPTNHSAVRRYYISRNRIVIYRKYFRVFPAWISHSMRESLRETLKCFLTEKDRARKFRNFVLGTWDGVTGKMGKREGL